jgi:undecaprenyl-diphosphatase
VVPERPLAVGGWIRDFDVDVFTWVVQHRAEPLDWLFVGLSALGQAGLLWIALAGLAARWARKPPLATMLVTAATVWTADVLALVPKTVIDRRRPYEVVDAAHPLLRWDVTSSFPSGHAATSAAGAVILAYLIGRGGWAFAALAAAVAYSRVYIGVHYPLDVIAGALLGAAVGLLAVGLIRALRPISAAPPR